MFWREVLESIKALLQIYGGLLGGVAVLGLIIAAIWLIGTGIGKGLEWLGIPTLLARAWTAAITKLKRIGRVLCDIVGLVLGFVALAGGAALVCIIATVGLWLFVYFLILGGTKNPAAGAWAVGSVIISLPLCLIGWPLLLKLDKEKPRLFHLPIVIAIAVLWVAPILAALPIVMTSD